MRTAIHPAFTLILLLAGGSSVCLPDSTVGEHPITAVSRPGATIQELMAGRVDPAADALWDSVAIIVSVKGIEERRPRTAAEWRVVRQQALTLIEATRVLGSPGRRVADKVTTPGPGELTAAEIQQRIDANHEAFVGFANALRVAGQQALAAIDARDPQRLMDAGGAIDAACEACHLTYWYPMPTQSVSGANP